MDAFNVLGESVMSRHDRLITHQLLSVWGKTRSGGEMGILRFHLLQDRNGHVGVFPSTVP